MFKAIFGKKEDSVIADATRYVEYGRSFAVFEDGSQYINRMGDELERMGYDIVYIDLMMPYHSHCCNIIEWVGGEMRYAQAAADILIDSLPCREENRKNDEILKLLLSALLFRVTTLPDGALPNVYSILRGNNSQGKNLNIWADGFTSLDTLYRIVRIHEPNAQDLCFYESIRSSLYRNNAIEDLLMRLHTIADPENSLILSKTDWEMPGLGKNKKAVFVKENNTEELEPYYQLLYIQLGGLPSRSDGRRHENALWIPSETDRFSSGAVQDRPAFRGRYYQPSYRRTALDVARYINGIDGFERKRAGRTGGGKDVADGADRQETDGRMPNGGKTESRTGYGASGNDTGAGYPARQKNSADRTGSTQNTFHAQESGAGVKYAGTWNTMEGTVSTERSGNFKTWDIRNGAGSVPGNSMEGQRAASTGTKSNRLYPTKIKKYLDLHIIKQYEAKKMVAMAIFKQAEELKAALQDGEYRKSKHDGRVLLLIGPTGTGKTMIASMAAEYAGLPYVKIDASQITADGWAGMDKADIFRQLHFASASRLSSASKPSAGSKLAAEFGIIILDEFDKFVGAAKNVNGRNYSIKDQQTILGMLDGIPVSTTSRQEAAETFNTGHNLFILTGAFTDLYEYRKEKGKPGIGFNAASREAVQENIRQELVKTGMLPELAGRINAVAFTDDLSADDIRRAIFEVEGNCIEEYRKMLTRNGISLEIDEDSLMDMIKSEMNEGLGVRGIKNRILEELDRKTYEAFETGKDKIMLKENEGQIFSAGEDNSR